MGSDRFDIVGIGACTIDTFYLVDEFPGGEGVYESDSSVISGGGPVATALAAAASLGSRTAMFDRIGDDWRGDRILAEFKNFGVDVSGITREPDSESSGATALVRRSDGARAITFTRATCRELEPEEINAEQIANADILHLNGRHHAASMRGCDIARENGTRISFDGGANRYRESSHDYVKQSDICIVALDFAERYTGKKGDIQVIAESLFSECRGELVVITDGVNGSWIYQHPEIIHQPAIPPNKLIDTTGCGDVYHGAFLHALSKGSTPTEAALLASQWASKTCEGLGGRSALTGSA